MERIESFLTDESREVIDFAYHKLVLSIFAWLNKPVSGDSDEAVVQYATRVENYRYFATQFSSKTASALVQYVTQALSLFRTNLSVLIDSLLRKQLDGLMVRMTSHERASLLHADSYVLRFFFIFVIMPRFSVVWLFCDVL